MGMHQSVGIDLVAMCVNDILAHGAEPLYFLDYFSTSKLDIGKAKEVISGITQGCLIAGCALLGGRELNISHLQVTQISLWLKPDNLNLQYGTFLGRKRLT